MMDIQNITIYGSGLIGCGWATHLLLKGIKNIVMFDINQKSLKDGLNILSQNLDFLVHEGLLDENKKEELIGLVKVTTNINESVENADLIIENGPEILSVKQEIIKNIESSSRADAIITTSTSGMLISEITKYAKHPERILGVHPYHPVYLLPLLEINKMDCTDSKALEDALAFFNSIDKKPVVLKKESDGYIGTHLMTTLLRESVSMVLNGVCTMEDIDTAFIYGPGMRYALFGIFTTLQLAGGNDGIHGLLCGPIGKATDKWLESFCNWQSWPKEAEDFFENSQEEMDIILSKRPDSLGKSNKDMEVYRDKGLLKILNIHGLL